MFGGLRHRPETNPPGSPLFGGIARRGANHLRRQHRLRQAVQPAHRAATRCWPCRRTCCAATPSAWGRCCSSASAGWRCALRIQALAKGYSGVTPELIDALIDDVQPRRRAGDPRAGQRRRQRRPGAAGAPGAGRDRRGTRLRRAAPDRERPASRSRSAAGPPSSASTCSRTACRRRRACRSSTARRSAPPSWPTRLVRARHLAQVADIAGGHDRRGDQEFADAVRPAHPGRSGRTPARSPVPPTSAGCWRTARSCRRTPTATRCRTPTACAACRRSTARCATPWRYITRVVECEMNAATDNPLVFADTGEVISGGNFHAQPIALAADLLAAAVTDLSQHQRAARREPRQPGPERPARLPDAAPRTELRA